MNAEVPAGQARGFLGALRDSSQTRPGAKLVSERFQVIAGLDAIEYTISTVLENVQIRYLAVVRGRYYYVLSSTGSPDQITDHESDAFLASLRFEGAGTP
jgi:hypothetical protein